MDYDLQTLRHSTAHVLAQAVLKLFPAAKLGIGPAIENGFYYDFELSKTLTPDDFPAIEKEMKKIIKDKLDYKKIVVGKDAAIKILLERNQTYKIDLINKLPPEEEITFYENGNFLDLCRGPHLDNTKEIKTFKLLSVSGAYWLGKEENTMLQRIYGTAFFSKQELSEHINLLEEAEKRDHRKIGKKHDLFSIQEKSGVGLVYWHPKGAMMRHLLESFWKEEHFKNDYELLYTPHIGQNWLWETSGHLQFYQENMYSPIQVDNQEYYLKPMNCPFHIMIYKSKLYSYRELPLRWAELGTVYRYEKSGVLHGLLRVRGFTQDDAHIICTPDQVEDEIHEVLKFSIKMWEKLGFKDLTYYISTRPEKYVGDKKQWETAETALTNAMKRENIKDYKTDKGGGAFYGPKIDIKVKDALQREWQMSTIQFDFNLPERFDMSYIGSDGQKHRPFMIHRALLGSLERFYGMFIEHCGGKFPLWISPRQFRILTITNDDYAVDIYNSLKQDGFRGELDNRNEKLGHKIKEARHDLIPYMIIIGDKESKNNTLGIRKRGSKDTLTMTLKKFKELIKAEIQQMSR